MKKYDILMVSTFFPPGMGGLAIHVLNLTRKLSELGHNISIIIPKQNYNKASKYFQHFKNVYPLKSFFLPGWPYPTLKSVGIPYRFGFEINSIIRNGNFDIIHVHGHHFPFSWFAVKSAKKYGVPSVLTLHGMYALNPSSLGGKSMIEDFLNKYFFNKIFSNIDAMISLTELGTKYAKIFGNKTQAYYTIPNGVDTQLYSQSMNKREEYRSKYNIHTNSIVILFSGRLEQVKGILEFAKAAKNLVMNDQIEVIILGAGSLEIPLKKIIAENKRIHFLGWMPVDKIHEIYIASDILAIPSRFESLPLSVIEAMNAGLHIVYSPVGGLVEFMNKYPRKSLIEEISAKAIEEVLSKIISSFDTKDIDESLRYASKFDWRKISEETCGVYDEIHI